MTLDRPTPVRDFVMLPVVIDPAVGTPQVFCFAFTRAPGNPHSFH